MTIGTRIKERPIPAIIALMTITLAGLLLLPPIPQDQSYHQFADQRTLLGVPNFWDVISNLPFIAVGVAGLRQFYRRPATAVIFSGMILTGFGSAYYHLDPNDSTLFWDRLPMTLCFAAILAAAIEERVDERAGAVMLWPLLVIGIASVVYWRWTGDLRLYVWAQFFPILALIIILQLFAPKHTGMSYWYMAAALYVLAKLFEFFDEEIFAAGALVSGHTLKHLAAAAACFAVLRIFQICRTAGAAHPAVTASP